MPCRRWSSKSRGWASGSCSAGCAERAAAGITSVSTACIKFFIGSFSNLKKFESALADNLDLKAELKRFNVGSSGYTDNYVIDEDCLNELNDLLAEGQLLYNFIKNQTESIYSSVDDQSWINCRTQLLRFGRSSHENSCRGNEYAGKFRVQGFPDTLRPSVTIDFTYELVNKSESAWCNDDQSIKLSYHWLSENNEMIHYEGKRTPLGVNYLSPGETFQVTSRISTPSEEGAYKLQLTLIKEKYAWLEHKGFEVKNVSVKIKK